MVNRSFPKRGRFRFEPQKERTLLLHLGAESRMLLDAFVVLEEELVSSIRECNLVP